MAKQILIIETAQKVSFHKEALAVEIDEAVHYFPLHSIQTVLFETDHNTVTIAALRQLADNGIPVLFCDYRRIPTAAVLPMTNYFERAARIEQQFTVSTQLKNRLWQKIIRQKIRNQAAVAELLNPMTSVEMRALVTSVNEGDKNLIEAHAAQMYFKTIVHEKFSRRSDAPLNHFFNYDYAILRSLITQRLMAHGLEPSIGIWHRGQRNALNLTYDLIEPFRPFVDECVLELIGETELTKENRAHLLSVTEQICQINGTTTTVSQALNTTIDSFIRAINDKSAAPLLLPERLKS